MTLVKPQTSPERSIHAESRSRRSLLGYLADDFYDPLCSFCNDHGCRICDPDQFFADGGFDDPYFPNPYYDEPDLGIVYPEEAVCSDCGHLFELSSSNTEGVCSSCQQKREQDDRFCTRFDKLLDKEKRQRRHQCFTKRFFRRR